MTGSTRSIPAHFCQAAVAAMVLLVAAPPHAGMATPISILGADSAAADAGFAPRGAADSNAGRAGDQGSIAGGPGVLGLDIPEKGLDRDLLDGIDKSMSKLTLRQVLHAMTTVHHASAAPANGGQTASRARVTSAPAGADDGPHVDLSEMLLDSEVAGAMLRAIVDVKTADGARKTFSILGMGNFTLDVVPEAHVAVVAEMSTGLSSGGRMGGSPGYVRYPDYSGTGAANAPVPRQNINLVRVVWNWIVDLVWNPIGIFALMTLTILVFLWMCVRLADVAQRWAVRTHR